MQLYSVCYVFKQRAQRAIERAVGIGDAFMPFILSGHVFAMAYPCHKYVISDDLL